MTDEEIDALADAAMNVAVAHIQDEMGIPDGGFAGIYFSGEEGEEEGYGKAVRILKDYIRAEQEFFMGG
jgi:hypothetical protein